MNDFRDSFGFAFVILHNWDVVMRVAFFGDDDLSSHQFASIERHELYGWSLEVALVVDGAKLC